MKFMRCTTLLLMSLLIAVSACGSGKTTNTEMKDSTFFNKLTAEEEAVIVHKATERPFTGEYNDFFEAGTYVCKRCDAPLYRSKDKFRSSCGWPSFDDEIKGAVKRTVDADGMRTEITCARCDAHLGHVFLGEGFTKKNTRHCVNSISLKFIGETTMKEIYFAGGCFWGTEHYFKQMRGVMETEVGYANGHTENPTYKEVCTDKTGFAETVRIVYDPEVISLRLLTEMYFKAIDPTSVNRQGHDEGTQYRTGIYYKDEADRATLQQVYDQIQQKVGKPLAVELQPIQNFYTAEEYHQDYLDKNPEGYCHLPVELFEFARKANRNQ